MHDSVFTGAVSVNLPEKQADICSGEEQRFLSSDDTKRVWLCVCRLDKHKHTIQSSGNKGRCCTSPSQAIWSVLPASLIAAVRWSTFGRAGLSLLTYISSQPQTSNHSSSHSYLSVHLNLRNTHSLSLSLCGMVKGSGSVTRYRCQSCCLLSFLHKSMHNSL